MKFRRKMVRFFSLLCFILLFFLLLTKTSIYVNTVPGDDNKLLQTLKSLQRAQIENTGAALRELNQNISIASSVNVTNNNTDVNSEEAERQQVRDWFDKRPGVNPSTLDPSKHPLFPGYVIKNPNVCKGESVDLLIYIHSDASHRDIRREFRETWASPHTFHDIIVRVIFILGLPKTHEDQMKVQSEYAAYGDIVQGNFIDAFQNLTFKAITMMTWVNSYCSQVRYLVKADDDMFVDIFRVVSDVVPKLAPKTLAIAGDVKQNMIILRKSNMKWNVHEKILPGRKTWPQFCSGYFCVMTGELIPKLYESSFGIKEMIPIDDAYLGLLIERDTALQNLTEFINLHDKISPNERPNPEEELKANKKFEFIAFGMQAGSHRKLWSVRLNRLSNWDQAHAEFHDAFQAADQDLAIIT